MTGVFIRGKFRHKQRRIPCECRDTLGRGWKGAGEMDMMTEEGNEKDIEDCQQPPEVRREAWNSLRQRLQLEPLNLDFGLLAFRIVKE